MSQETSFLYGRTSSWPFVFVFGGFTRLEQNLVGFKVSTSKSSLEKYGTVFNPQFDLSVISLRTPKESDVFI